MQSTKMDAEDNLASRVASFSHYLKTGDQENFVQKIGGIGEDPISATISKETSFPSGRIKSSSVIKPAYAINLSNSIDSQDCHRIASSFPSLLHDPLEKIALKVKPGPVQDPKAAALVLSRAGPTVQVEKMNPTNGEIGVFGADKYFNMKLEYVNTMKNESKNQGLIDFPWRKSNLSSATPSVYSEASSWNSGAALLKNFPRNTPQRKPKMPLGRRIIATFGCTGRCMDSGAVNVAENGRGDTRMGHGAKLSQQGPKRGEPFTSPILCSDAQILTGKKLEDEKLEELRKSIEVFGSDTMKRGDIATNLERKLSMLTWDAIPRSSSHPTTTIGSTTVCDDMASDASSDLFEIENISGNGYSILNMQQGAGDDLSAGCMTPTTQYAPSEASIEWSVFTASAADFSSVISDYEEKHLGIGGNLISRDSIEKSFRIKKPAGGTEVQKPRPSGLLGCKSQKAVNVSENVHQTRVERY